MKVLTFLIFPHRQAKELEMEASKEEEMFITGEYGLGNHLLKDIKHRSGNLTVNSVHSRYQFGRQCVNSYQNNIVLMIRLFFNHIKNIIVDLTLLKNI